MKSDKSKKQDKTTATTQPLENFPSQETMAWLKKINIGMERMSRDEAYRLEIVRKSLNQPKSRVVSDAGILGGTPVVEGTRVPAETVLAEVDSGSTTYEIFHHYPSLPCDGIEVCIEWRNAGKPITTIK